MKPGVFPCKVAAGGDERYLQCAASFFCRTATVASSCLGCACACVVIGCFGICGCRSQWNGYMIVVTFCCHVCVETCGFATKLVPPLCSATSGCFCVRSFMRFLNLWLQIALEWLHDCCHALLPCA